LRCTEVIHTEWICFYFLSFLFSLLSRGSPYRNEWMNENFLPFMLPLLLPFTLYTHWERKFIFYVSIYINKREDKFSFIVIFSIY
jgi:hypothetical protein